MIIIMIDINDNDDQYGHDNDNVERPRPTIVVLHDCFRVFRVRYLISNVYFWPFYFSLVITRLTTIVFACFC